MKYRTLRNIAVLVGVVAFIAAAPASASPQTIYIPKIGLYTELASSLDSGPWMYWRDSDTVAIAGHRTTHSKPFSDLDRLNRGDLIRAAGKNYRVARITVIRPWQTWVLNWRGLVLSACTPKGSAAYRIVVLASPF